MAREAIQAKLADAIAAVINASGLVAVTAAASWADWDEELQDLDTLNIDVVPSEVTSELNDRGELVYTLGTDIGIRQRFGQANQDSGTGRIARASLDALSLLTEQMHELFAADRPTTQTQAVWLEVEYKAPFIRKHLREFRQWTSIIKTTHDWTKPIGAE